MMTRFVIVAQTYHTTNVQLQQVWNTRKGYETSIGQ